jgi:hypothetical protein
MDQDVSTDHQIERLTMPEGLSRCLLKANLREPGYSSPLRRYGENVLISINPKRFTGWSDELSSKHRDIADGTAQIKDWHAWGNLHVLHETLCDGSQHRCLVGQTANLSLRMAEYWRSGVGFESPGKLILSTPSHFSAKALE